MIVMDWGSRPDDERRRVGKSKESGTKPATTLVKETETSCNRRDVSVVGVERTAFPAVVQRTRKALDRQREGGRKEGWRLVQGESRFDLERVS